MRSRRRSAAGARLPSPASASSTSPSGAPARASIRVPVSRSTSRRRGSRASAPGRSSRRPSTADPAPTGFGERLAGRVAERRSQLVLGLDPDPARLWPQASAAAPADDPAEAAADAVTSHCAAVIEAAGPSCVAVKLQLACFERLGAPGWTALERAAAAARDAGLLVIADGKRGDVPVTAAAYAQALLSSTPTPWGDVAGLGADAVTANPLLGDDALEPLIAAARDAVAGRRGPRARRPNACATTSGGWRPRGSLSRRSRGYHRRAMPDRRSARFLAPLALVVFALGL